MGILNKKKQPPSIEIPQSVRKQVEDDLLQHFSQYEFPRNGSETALSRVLLDKLVAVDAIELSADSIRYLTNEGTLSQLLTKACIEWAEVLDSSNELEPLLDEYFKKYGNFRGKIN